MKSQITKLISVFACICLLLTAIIIPASAAETSVTISFADKANRTDYDSASKQVWEQNGIKVTNNKAGSTSAVGDYANPGRFYKSSEVIVEYPGMTKLVIDSSGLESKYVAWDKSFSDSNATATVDSGITTITFATPVDSFTFASMSAQCRAFSMTVYAVAAEEPEECKHIGGYASSNGDETHNIVCDSCEEVLQTAVACTDADADGKCDECLGDVVVETPETPSEPTTPATSATITFGADKANRTSYSTSQQIWEENGIKVTNDKSASTSNVGDYGNPARFYKSSKVTIEYPGMTKIVIDSVTYSDNDYAGAWVDSFDTTLGTAVATDGDVTITLNSATDAVVFEKLAAQARAYSITVYTGETGGTTPDEPDTPVVPDEPDTPENTDPAADSTLTIKEAIALGASKAHNVYTEGKYYVTGEITEVYNDMYGNMKIKDAEGNILTIYGTYSADGSDRYDAMAVKPVAGDTVKIYGIVGQYNNTPQIKNGWIVEHTPATTPDEPDTPVVPDEPDTPENTDPAADSTLTIEEAIALGNTKDKNVYTEGKYYITGKVTAIASTTYGNMYVADEAGNEIYVYGTYGADGEDRYDALETKPVVGDTVTLYGVIGKYNDVQMKNAWIIEVVAGDGAPENTDPEADTVLSIKDAIALGASKKHDVYTEAKYYITGTILEVYNEQYGNLYLVDAEGNQITVYGSWSEDGTIGYAEMENKPVAGDTVTLYGVIGQYNGVAQMKNAWFTTAPASDDNTNNDDNSGESDVTTPDDDTTGDNGTTSPVTGDSVGAVVTMALAAAAVIVYTKKRR